MKGSKAEEYWERSHPKSSNGVPSRLYTDENPATTIKGTGFKDRKTAERTIVLTSQKGVRYKQYWTIKAMHERARYHPHPTEGMKDAMEVFARWLKDEDGRPPLSSEQKKEQQSEWEEYRKLCASAANRHSHISTIPINEESISNKELEIRAREDLRCATDSLFRLLKLARRSTAALTTKASVGGCEKRLGRTEHGVEFPLVAFVALFGGPGIHGYGKHRISNDSDSNGNKEKSQVIIDGMNGLLELVPSHRAKAISSVGGTDPELIKISYDRLTTIARAELQYPEGRATIASLWNKAAKMPPRHSNTTKLDTWEAPKRTSSRNVRGRTSRHPRLPLSPRQCESWKCEACTFEHVGIAKELYLTCELCGSNRPPAKKKPKRESSIRGCDSFPKNPKSLPPIRSSNSKKKDIGTRKSKDREYVRERAALATWLEQS